MMDNYKGFDIVYRTAMFTVEAIVYNNGKRQWAMSSNGTDKADAWRRIKNVIDYHTSEVKND